MPLLLTVVESRLAVCRMEAGGTVPDWVDHAGEFVSITRIADELSIVCARTVSCALVALL